MKRKVIGCFIVGSLVLIGCAQMKERTSINNLTDEQVEAYNADPNNTDKIICKKEKPTGSNIPRRVCRKESWIKERSDHDQRVIEEFQRNTRPPGP